MSLKLNDVGHYQNSAFLRMGGDRGLRSNCNPGRLSPLDTLHINATPPMSNPSHVKLSQGGYTHPYSQHGWVLAKVLACIDAFIFIDAYGIGKKDILISIKSDSIIASILPPEGFGIAPSMKKLYALCVVLGGCRRPCCNHRERCRSKLLLGSGMCSGLLVKILV